MEAFVTPVTHPIPRSLKSAAGAVAAGYLRPGSEMDAQFAGLVRVRCMCVWAATKNAQPPTSQKAAAIAAVAISANCSQGGDVPAVAKNGVSPSAQPPAALSCARHVPGHGNSARIAEECVSAGVLGPVAPGCAEHAVRCRSTPVPGAAGFVMLMRAGRWAQCVLPAIG
jgi:hypothetical protein